MKNVYSYIISLVFMVILCGEVFGDDVKAPEIVSAVPDNAEQGDALIVTITGNEAMFSMGTSVITQLYQNDYYITTSSTDYLSPTSINAYFNIPDDALTGLYSLRVRLNEIPEYAEMVDAFTINEGNIPELISITPNYSVQDGEVAVTITGLNTNFSSGSGTYVWLQQGSSTIYSDPVYPHQPEVINTEFNIGRYNPVGYWDLYVDDDFDPVLSLPSSFYIYPFPGKIIDFTPDSIKSPESLWVSITGEDTYFHTGSNSYTSLVQVERDGQTYETSTLSVSSPYDLTAYLEIPDDAPLGLYDVRIYNSDNPFPAVLEDGFEVYKDTTKKLLSIIPDYAFWGDTLTVAITCQNTNFTTGGINLVRFIQGSSTIYADNVNPVSDTYLEADIHVPVSTPLSFWDLSIWNVSDYIYHMDALQVFPECGDANYDLRVDITDAVFIINYIFVEGAPLPLYPKTCNVNCDEVIDVSDAVYLINFIFVLPSPSPCDCD